MKHKCGLEIITVRSSFGMRLLYPLAIFGILSSSSRISEKIRALVSSTWPLVVGFFKCTLIIPFQGLLPLALHSGVGRLYTTVH
jgi:hypothetical protein